MAQQNPDLFQWSSSYGVYVFPGRVLDGNWARRVAARERWGRDAAKQDDGGRGPQTWTIETDWGDTTSALELPNARYPDDLNWFERALRATGETGNLYLPRQGIRRAKVATFSRRLDASAPRLESTRVTFVEDNEDTQAVTQWLAPSGKSALPTLSSTLKSKSGAAGTSLSTSSKEDLGALSSEVSTLANQPAGWSSDLASRAAELDGRLRAAEAAYSSGGDEHGRLFRFASSASAHRTVAELRDALARIVHERRASSGSPPQVRTYPVAVSVVMVAAKERIEPATVLEMNPNLVGVALAIPAGTPILVP